LMFMSGYRSRKLHRREEPVRPAAVIPFSCSILYNHRLLSMNRLSCFRTRVVCLGVAMLVLVSSAVTAQAQSGVSLTGVVADPTGAVLPTANVEVRTAAGVVAQTTTDNAGAFRVDRLPRGTYEVVVTFEGFQPTTLRVAIAARPPAPVRIVMPLAGVTQEITVSNSAANVKTEAAANLNTSSLDATSMEKLPVFDQDIVSTMSLPRLERYRHERRHADRERRGDDQPDGLGVRDPADQNEPGSVLRRIPATRPRSHRDRAQAGLAGVPRCRESFFRDSAFDARNAFAAVKPPEQRRVAEGYVGGPAFHSDKTSFSVSVRASADDLQAIVFADGPTGPIQQNVPAPYRDILAAGT